MSTVRRVCPTSLDTVRVVTSARLTAQCDPKKWEPRSFYVPGGRLVERYALRRDLLPPSLEHVRLFVNLTGGTMTLEASLPRSAFGHNAVLGYDVQAVLHRLDHEVVGWGLGRARSRVRPLVEWVVRRADIAFDFVPRATPFKHALRALLALQPSHGLLTTRINEQTAYFHGEGKRRRFEIAIYDKAAETKKAHPQHADLARGAIRVEVRLKEKDVVRRAFELNADPQVQDVTPAERLQVVLVRKLALLEVRPGLESVITGRDELAKRLGARVARRLWPFVELRGQLPRWEVCRRLGIADETGRRYERELRAARLYPAAVSVTGVLEELLQQVEESANAASPSMPAPTAAAKEGT